MYIIFNSIGNQRVNWLKCYYFYWDSSQLNINCSLQLLYNLIIETYKYLLKLFERDSYFLSTFHPSYTGSTSVVCTFERLRKLPEFNQLELFVFLSDSIRNQTHWKKMATKQILNTVGLPSWASNKKDPWTIVFLRPSDPDGAETEWRSFPQAHFNPFPVPEHYSESKVPLCLFLVSFTIISWVINTKTTEQMCAISTLVMIS